MSFETDMVGQADGALLAARYAFMPNRLRYCGGDSNAELFEYAAQGVSDDGLKEMLVEFETMYPYLRLIAEANKIVDPFDYRVVEAYWLGNELLENISMNNFYRYLVDAQHLKKKLKPAQLEKVFGKIPLGAKPHHSFHVFNIPKRTGHYPIEHTLKTMDECRIGWGKIVSLPEDIFSGDKETINFTKKIEVISPSLSVVLDKVILNQGQKKSVWLEIKNKSFIKDLKVGDWVSIHWGWVCDILEKKQVDNLEKWTRYNLSLLN